MKATGQRKRSTKSTREDVDALRDKFSHITPFHKRISNGELCTVERAAELAGYNAQHLRRLCDQKKVEHERREPSGPLGPVRYFFTVAQVELLTLKTVVPDTKFAPHSA